MIKQENRTIPLEELELKKSLNDLRLINLRILEDNNTVKILFQL